MMPLNPRTKSVTKLFSKDTGKTHIFEMMNASEVNPKMDVFMNRTTGRVVYRDSIRRRFETY
jgi:hypothetical protein